MRMCHGSREIRCLLVKPMGAAAERAGPSLWFSHIQARECAMAALCSRCVSKNCYHDQHGFTRPLTPTVAATSARPNHFQDFWSFWIWPACTSHGRRRPFTPKTLPLNRSQINYLIVLITLLFSAPREYTRSSWCMKYKVWSPQCTDI